MKNKIFLIIVISLLLVCLIGTATIQIAIDPLFQYHSPWFGLKPVITNERYQNAGVAKTFEFDNIILGNSMSQNFRISDVESLFGGETVKLTFSGSSFLDWSYILKILIEREKMPQNVLINIDPIVMSANSKELNHELPMYLYDQNILNDVEYFYSFDVIRMFTLEMLYENDFDYDSVFSWDRVYSCGKEIVLGKYVRPEKTFNDPDVDSYLSNLEDNLKMFSEYFKIMDGTNFVFFFSPFSMLSWDEKNQNNEIELYKQAYSFACERLLQFDNVSVFLWSDEEMLSVMSDLDNYKDLTHYGAPISKNILDRIRAKTGILTKENYQTEIDRLFLYIANFNYDALFE